MPILPSPNLSLAVDLGGGFDALLLRASGKRKRKKHRSQMRKFEAVGSHRRIEAETPDEVNRLLDAFFEMKEFRFRKMGIANVFGDEQVRAFFRALFTDALAEDKPSFVLHGLEVAGKLRAVTGSSRSGKRLICEFGAIAEDDLGHTSPGDFLFFDNIQEACETGFAVYDFSVGDEPYKRLWCDIETQHFEVLIPLTLKGRALALDAAARRADQGLHQEQPDDLEADQDAAPQGCRTGSARRRARTTADGCQPISLADLSSGDDPDVRTESAASGRRRAVPAHGVARRLVADRRHQRQVGIAALDQLDRGLRHLVVRLQHGEEDLGALADQTADALRVGRSAFDDDQIVGGGQRLHDDRQPVGGAHGADRIGGADGNDVAVRIEIGDG